MNREIYESCVLTVKYRGMAVNYEGELVTIVEVKRVGDYYWTTLSNGACINLHPVNASLTYNEDDLVPNPK